MAEFEVGDYARVAGGRIYRITALLMVYSGDTSLYALLDPISPGADSLTGPYGTMIHTELLHKISPLEQLAYHTEHGGQK